MPGRAWSCLVVPGHAWSCLVMPGRAWSCLVMPGHAWSCLVMPGRAWSCLVVPGHDNGLGPYTVSIRPLSLDHQQKWQKRAKVALKVPLTHHLGLILTFL
eukprot:1159471-Pelagomonas_calceolata.AAC.5